ncbi:hypothetical protein DQW77_13845 [Roseovarius sp. TE539]|uniref:DUF2927 domain-containing protein n=1 Tax=Roseovarius sp. TE539 TaxID=2249812 RepID=UPI000DDF88DB|nr:DUF2927 domain-containing protein [Roseovarius sp. TE539]RBI70530.1 hypothetical protein DQW77_13845 [Roseovarius sp. TE539]
MRAGRIILHLLTGFGLMTLAACMDVNDRPATEPPPQDAALPAPDAEAGPSPRSRALARHYANVQRSLLARGLLRTDGGGVDTPYDADDLLRNFERIAFYDEYARDGGLRHSDGQAGGLRKWAEPVRIAVEFGDSVPKEQREEDRQAVAAYSARLSRITGHPIRAGAARPNFNVLIMGEDDRDRAIARIRQIVPGISPNSIDLFRGLPRSIHCLVVAFSSGGSDYVYKRAIAFIRAEHPDLLRRSCIHEELAQGLGLANDSPRARPSIFNDDDEFALLTTHDEELLRLLYNPALSPGMTVAEARPILRRLLASRIGPF